MEDEPNHGVTLLIDKNNTDVLVQLIYSGLERCYFCEGILQFKLQKLHYLQQHQRTKKKVLINVFG